MRKSEYLIALLESNTPEEMEEFLEKKGKKKKKKAKRGSPLWPYPFWWGRRVIVTKGPGSHGDHDGHFPNGCSVPGSHGGDMNDAPPPPPLAAPSGGGDAGSGTQA